MVRYLLNTRSLVLRLAGMVIAVAVGCASDNTQQVASPAHDETKRTAIGDVAGNRYRESFTGQGRGFIARTLNTEFWALFEIKGTDTPQYRIIVVEVPDWAERPLLGATRHLPFEGEIVVNSNPHNRTLEFVTRDESMSRFNDSRCESERERNEVRT